MKAGAADIALFNLGFRAFFLGAGVFSVVSISLWAAVYFFQFPLSLRSVSATQWHAHEMIYGYGLAVIAGFLLTAVKNWTGIQTLKGLPLMMLFGSWLTARLLWLFGTQYLMVAAVFDLLFVAVLIACVCYPVVKVQQWRQIAVLSKLILIAAFNGLFYLGALEIIDRGAYWGVYGGLYLVIGLILTMGRRVLPFFIEGGVGYRVELHNSRWLDFSSLALFLGFFFCELLSPGNAYAAYLALGLFGVNAVRLLGWHTPGIWKKSLLWSLYLSFWFICAGFLLFAGVYFWGLSKFIALHAFAFGGIGVITISMMSRVSIGHTGRDIHRPPGAMGYTFGILLLGAIVRVVVPILDVQRYALWVGLSQLLWIAAFLIFILVFFPILITPRIDGKQG